MAIDQVLIGTVTQQVMELLERHHGEGATIDSIGIIVAVDTPQNESAVHFNFVDSTGNGLARYRQRGLLEEIKAGL